MNRRFAWCLVACLILLERTAVGGERPPAKKIPKFEPPPIRVSKKTTYVLGPLRKDGSVDFAAAVNARASKGVTPENNAAVLIAQVVSKAELSPELQAGLYKKLGIPRTAKPKQRLLGPWEFAERTVGKKHERYARALMKQEEESRKRLWKRKEMPELAAWLKQNRKPLAVVRKAVERPRWYGPIIHVGDNKIDRALMFSLLPLAQSCRDFGRALAAEATLAVQDGRHGEAVDNLRHCHRLARHVASGNSVIEHLVGIAIERFADEATIAILKSGKLTARQLARLDESLDSLPPMPSCAEKINNFERLALIDAVIHIRREGFSVLRMLASTVDLNAWRQKVAWAVFSALVDWNRVLEIVNEEFDRAYEAVKTKPYQKRKAALEQYRERRYRDRVSIPRSVDELCWRFFNWGHLDGLVFTRVAGNLVTGLLMPAFSQAQFAEDQLEAQRELVRIAVALERYRQAHRKFPAKLKYLQPRFLKTIPTDHFIEKPFHYKRTKTGYLLYSVGPNMKDEGGKTPDPDSFSSDDPDDIVVRIQLAK